MSHDPARSAAIAAELRARIIGGQLPPGARIRQEEIAAEFGVSRIPIREALRSLASSGLVTLVPSTGAWVTELSLEECREVYLMRERLEPLLLSMAIPLHTPESMAEFVHLAEAVEPRHRPASSSRPTATSTARSWPCPARCTAERDRRPPVESQPLLPQAPAHPEVSRRKLDIVAEHRMILRAIEIGDVESAEAVMAAHIRQTRRLVEASPELFDRG
jgi:DNA-binding GntR family transcriptional regulator